jgi:ABC-type Na+ efflux pump permease subunit
MWRESWFVARQDIRRMLKTRETLMWLFAMPILFIYFIGTITSSFSGAPAARKDPLVLQAPQGAGFLVDRVTKHLEASGYGIVSSGRETGSVPRRLVIPDGFTESVIAGKQVTVQFWNDTPGLDRNYHEMRVKRAVFTALADVIAASRPGGHAEPDAFVKLDALPRTIALDVQAAGKRRKIPTGFEQAIPGIMVMFALLVLLTSGAVLLVIERREGLLRRLASTPIPPRTIILGKWQSRLALAVIQIAFAMLAGTVLFRMNWGPHLIMVFVSLLSWCSVCASLGLLLGNVVRTEGQAIGVGVLAGNLLAALGGCWWPIEITPAWMQSLAGMLPTGWAMGAMHRLISYQSGPAGVIVPITLMLALSITLGLLAARHWKWQ